MTNWPSSNNTCTGAWFRTFPETNPSPPIGTPNVSVVGLKQNKPIDTVALQNFPIGTVYNLSGGDFQVNVLNSSNLFLEEVCVNVVFGFNEFYQVCPNKPSKQLKFTSLNLAPGESTWLAFGDIYAQGQNIVPEEICFWTSSPNEQPDAVHEDDRFCIPASYTVAVKDPDFIQVAFSPNPADDFIEISFSENMDGEVWQIFDATGRLAATGFCTNNRKIRLETAQLPNGFYLLSLKNKIGKLVVQH